LLILCREEPGMITVTYMVKDIIGKIFNNCNNIYFPQADKLAKVNSVRPMEE
jgi:hypothetical protein